MTDSELIDVVMCTWNSNKPYFRKCLLSIKTRVNVHHFIVIDRYSSDGTVEVVRSVFPDAKIFQTSASLANARRIGIKYVDTKYFAFIDDDIEVSERWFTELIYFVISGRRVGAVQGFLRLYVDYLDKAQLHELNHRKEPTVEITGRGWTNNTLLMTEIVRDFNPPRTVHSWEDFLITQHVIKKGYRWLEIYEAQVTNYGDAESSYVSELRRYFLRGRWHGAGARLVNESSSSCWQQIATFLLKTFWSFGQYLILAIAISDPRVLLVRICGRLGYLDGFLSPKENTIPYGLHEARS